jgi:hypothetical protein
MKKVNVAYRNTQQTTAEQWKIERDVHDRAVRAPFLVPLYRVLETPPEMSLILSKYIKNYS